MVTKKRDIATEEIVATEIENLDSKIDANKDFVEIEETYSDSDERKDDSSDNEEIEGWADAMRKVLSKTGPKNAETMILAKESLPKENTELKKERTERKNRLKRKRAWEDMNYKKPDPLKKNFERDLKKTATRGVIQLFNAVRKYQTDMEEKLKEAKTETKKERLYKNIDKGKFLEMINRDEKSAQTLDTEDAAPESPFEDTDQPAWEVLRDDYMLGNDMADWDKLDNDEDKPVDNKKLKERKKKKIKKS